MESLSAKPKHRISKELPKDFRELADSAIDHFGTMLDNMKFLDLVDVAIYAGLAKLGYDKLPEILPVEIRLLWGPLAFKLATTSSVGNGVEAEFLGFAVKMPINSQVVGLSMLASLGFATLPWADLGKVHKEQEILVETGTDILFKPPPARPAEIMITDEQVFAEYPELKEEQYKLIMRGTGLDIQAEFGGWSQEEADEWKRNCESWRERMEQKKKEMRE